MTLPPRGHGEGMLALLSRGTPVSLPGMITGFWSSSHPLRWAGGSSLPPGAFWGLPAPSLAHWAGQGLGDPPLKALRRDTKLSHHPGDEGKADWRKGDK